MEKVNFSRIDTPSIDLPELLKMQKQSYRDFLQYDVEPDKRKIMGLQATFLDVLPITNADGTYIMEFKSYVLGTPRYSSDDAINRDTTHAVPVKAWFRLLQKQEGGKIKEIAEQEVYLCDLPIMSDTATFIINGAERVIVSQLHRSPGVIFEVDKEKNISSYGKSLYFARMIPYRGAWVEFEYDINNILYVRIDKKRKFLATTLLRAIGIESDEEILKIFYKTKKLHIEKEKPSSIEGKILAEDLVDKQSGEVFLEANHEITRDILIKIKGKDIKTISVLDSDPSINDVTMRITLQKDTMKTKKDAINAIYRLLRAQEFITPQQAETYLDNLIFKSIRKYDLTKVGRYKINKKLNVIFDEMENDHNFKFTRPVERKRTLTKEDIIATIKYLVLLNNSIVEFGDKKQKIEIDDIDHLGNRRVRAVGELLENQVRIGLAQMARLIREKMNMQDKSIMTPRTVINTAPLVGIIRKFFGTSQLSQFMDQTNPLAEMTHKRRLSALGPGGLHRKRAGFEVRDVHHTHYGRICPIETPEGPNIGLITSLACFASVNEYGLIESPYRLVEHGKVQHSMVYLTAERENEARIAQANARIDKNGRFMDDLVLCRYRGDFPLVSPKDVNYMDISPIQVVSISTALIPFLEHDDANRALMGSNMQRQSVPLLLTERPLVGTGIEARIAKDSGSAVVAKNSGRVIAISADHIAVWKEDASQAPQSKDETNIDIYRLKKYVRSNQDTCINQIPLVNKGDLVRKEQIIADGPAIAGGELALGKNLLVGFMPWEGYNFEDAILISDRLVTDDIFTSLHIQEYQVEARDTKMGSEEITRDIPNVGADALLNLDENGIVRVGAEVVPGDILVGKVAPKGEQQVTPEERLLKVIFGKKSEDVQDASLRVPPGVSGKVLGIKVFMRKEKLSRKEENARLREMETKYAVMMQDLRREKKDKIHELKKAHDNKKIKKQEYNREKDNLSILFQKREQEVRKELAKEKEMFRAGDELPVTVNQVVKVYVISRRKIQVGDKLAGRHGNKGVIAKILPRADMPYLPDGTPLDVVLSPLSVPSRMNVGQLLETMLGWACKVLNIEAVSPVFDGASEEKVRETVRKAKDALRKRGMPDDYLPDDNCRITLYDGRTGETFINKVTIGYMYLMKLAHLVEDKIHARSTGPYSLITRQPLGGKAQFGGQRFGEMEVWAVEGFGAAHVLKEFLTVKSDDVTGRTKMYEAIIKGESYSESGVPESFKVLVKELQALGLNVLLERREKQEEKEKTKVKRSKEKAKA